MKEKTALVWFRNDLRVEDNQVLSSAVARYDRIIAVYCFDPKSFEKNQFGFRKTEKFRAKFLIETIQELKKGLKAHNISLLTYNKAPEVIIPKIVDKHNVSPIFCQKEWIYEELQCNIRVKEALSDTFVEWNEIYDQFLYHPEDCPFEKENIPDVFTNFRKKCEKYVAIRPLVTIQSLTADNLIEPDTMIPTLSDLGFEDFEIDRRTAFPFSGGESNAKQRIETYFWETHKLSYYKKTRNGLVGKDYSSKLSAWLANGSISARQIYWEVKKYEKEVAKNQSTYWLIFELIWRDYFKYISLKYKDQIFYLGGILNKDYHWSSDTKLIQDWVTGNTEEPFVNANMKELNRTGWMSNRGRQNVASYFAKELQLDWRIGAAYFESLLIDYDVHSNYGNWMYVSGVGNDPRDRKFNVRLQADRYDPQQKFQSLWLQPTLFDI